LTDLNTDPSTNFGVDFTAVRSYAEWDVKLEEMDSLHVDVVPAGQPVCRLADRGGTIEHQVVAHIGVRKRFRRDQQTRRFELSEVDDLILITQKISEFFSSDSITGRPRTLSDFPKASWLEEGEGGNRSQILQLCDKAMLRQHSQYTGVVQLVYEVFQAPS